MNEMTKKEIRTIAEKLEASFNPYKEKAVKYYVGGAARYIWADRIYTEDEIRAAYVETAEKDVKMGYEQRMIGYYDKWYRYCHADEGRAYDAGVKKACTMVKCSEELCIIECMH